MVPGMIAFIFRAATLLALAFPAVALAAHSDWSTADESELRLLLTSVADGSVKGGIEITLDPSWYTYWRNPGEAGVPPVFDFSGSENVADVEVLYPAPTRHDDGTSVSLVYQDAVVFPLAVKPQVADQPITLRLAATFGVCSDICVPTNASAEVTLVPGAKADPIGVERLRAFEERIPKMPEPGRFEIAKVTPDGDALTIDVRMPESSYTDLFADPPAGWYIGQPAFIERVD